MAAPALYLDEDVRPLLGRVLRERGHDVLHVLEVGDRVLAIRSSSSTPSRHTEPS